MHVSIIVAAAKNGAIGKDNQLLWRLPDDLKRFKQLTLGHPMIMGRKTYESIGRPLPGRTSIVVTRNADFNAEGIVVSHSLDEALQTARDLGTDEAFIVGGGELYRQAMPLTDRIYLTEVDADIEGDTYFQINDLSEWTEERRIAHPADERHIFEFQFVDFSKKAGF